MEVMRVEMGEGGRRGEGRGGGEVGEVEGKGGEREGGSRR